MLWALFQLSPRAPPLFSDEYTLWYKDKFSSSLELGEFNLFNVFEGLEFIPVLIKWFGSVGVIRNEDVNLGFTSIVSYHNYCTKLWIKCNITKCLK